MEEGLGCCLALSWVWFYTWPTWPVSIFTFVFASASSHARYLALQAAISLPVLSAFTAVTSWLPQPSRSTQSFGGPLLDLLGTTTEAFGPVSGLLPLVAGASNRLVCGRRDIRWGRQTQDLKIFFRPFARHYRSGCLELSDIIIIIIIIIFIIIIIIILSLLLFIILIIIIYIKYAQICLLVSCFL